MCVLNKSWKNWDIILEIDRSNSVRFSFEDFFQGSRNVPETQNIFDTRRITEIEGSPGEERLGAKIRGNKNEKFTLRLVPRRFLIKSFPFLKFYSL